MSESLVACLEEYTFSKLTPTIPFLVLLICGTHAMWVIQNGTFGTEIPAVENNRVGPREYPPGFYIFKIEDVQNEDVKGYPGDSVTIEVDVCCTNCNVTHHVRVSR